MSVFDRSKLVISKIQVVAGDPPITLFPSDSMVKRLDMVFASSDAHNTFNLVVHTISI